MSVAVVRYNAGNVKSVVNALERIGANYRVTDDAQELQSADRVIFPGVGSANSAMEYLRASGLDRTLTSLASPVLGICLGMQLLCTRSEEGSTECLGIISGEVKRFIQPEKVPHTGWSRVMSLNHPIFEGIPAGSYFYFVHSYHLTNLNTEVKYSHCLYGDEKVIAALEYQNIYGTQFHPEKSQNSGLRLLKAFCLSVDKEASK
jgi:glutamine amidotransferase